MSDKVFQNKLTNTTLVSLFLQQSLMDSQADFERAVNNPSFPHWDCIVVTASNSAQADGYRKQIEYRRSLGKVSPYTDFMVVADRDNKRVGSAGSTLFRYPRIEGQVRKSVGQMCYGYSCRRKQLQNTAIQRTRQTVQPYSDRFRRNTGNSF